MRKEIFNQKVIPLFFLSLLVASLGVLIGFFIPPVLFIPIVIAEFIILFATYFLRKNGNFPYWLLFLFVFLTGITTTPIVYFAGLNAGPLVVFEALGITTIVFGGLASYVYITKKDFRSWGSLLFGALIGAILVGVVNIFLNNSAISFIMDFIVLLVFMGFVLFDMSKILRDYHDTQISDAVLALYLDFLNIFIRILMILAGNKKRDW